MTKSASIWELGQKLRNGELGAEALTRASLERVNAVDGQVKAITHLCEASVLADAQRIDGELQRGIDKGPMHGIPYVVKDIYDVAGLATTCNSNLRVNEIATVDSAVVERLRAGGAIFLGKVNTYEFAMTVPGPGLPFPSPRNPWNTAHVTAGSSSGSAAAVAAGMVRLGLGSDSGGSIRGPAAYCGVVGLKPTYGRVSKRGVFPLSWSMDHCGPITGSVHDAALALQVMAGYDEWDPGSSQVEVPQYSAGLHDGVAGMRIGVPWDFFRNSPALQPAVLQSIERTLGQLQEAGARVVPIQLPPLEQFIACGRVILASEMFAVHRHNLQNHIEGYNMITAGRLAMGAAVGAADYLDAIKLRRSLINTLDTMLDSVDCLATACALSTAPRYKATDRLRHWPLQLNMFNVTGHPALSLPTGLDPDGLPMSTKQPPAEAGGFGLRTESPDTRRLNGASVYGSVLKSSFGFASK